MTLFKCPESDGFIVEVKSPGQSVLVWLDKGDLVLRQHLCFVSTL